MIHTLTKSYEYDRVIHGRPDPVCPYCDKFVTVDALPVIALLAQQSNVLIHRECAAATSAKINNLLDQILAQPRK